MKKRRLAARRQASSALVITLLALMLLTIIVVSFMQTMSLALTTSKSYSDIRRATLAAQAGLDTAIAQISLATGTNLAFVTGSTNYPTSGLPAGTGGTNFPLTVIGAGNLTNFDQMMPLVSGPISELTNFGNPGFSNNFNTYASLRASGNPATTIDVNTSYQFIQDIADTNRYRATWVTMTNMVGNQATYTRYAYIVLDDAARMNPTLMTGAGTGYVNATNWYAGPQDINATNLLTDAGANALTATQLQQVTNSAGSFGYSDATLGQAFTNRTAYEAVKHLFTSQTNASFDVIPAWYPNGGLPKYNINDLATNPAYGTTASARATNVANIIMRDLPNFYQRDCALPLVGDSTTYVQRLANCMVDYINPYGTYTQMGGALNGNSAVSSGDEPGVFPNLIAVRWWTTTTLPSTNATYNFQYYANVWNPYTTPVTITNATFIVANRGAIDFGSTTNVPPTYNLTTNFATPLTVNPNQVVALTFPAQTGTITTSPASSALSWEGDDQYTNTVHPRDQFQMYVNGQLMSQTPGPWPFTSGAAPVTTPGGGMDNNGGAFSLNANNWNMSYLDTQGSEVADPRFGSFYNSVWGEKHSTSYSTGSAYFDGVTSFTSGHEAFNPTADWTYRDYVPTNPVLGIVPPNLQTTPDLLTSSYVIANAAAAPEVVRNGPMVSIGELGHIFDPAYASDNQSTNMDSGYGTAVTGSGSGYFSPYNVGGARSLRIGRPDAPPSGISLANTGTNWNVNGERAQDLLDIFTINNTNLVSGGVAGRINPNTASTNVLAAVLSGIQINSVTNSTQSFTNTVNMASNVVANRPYSSLSDLYKIMPLLTTNVNYSPNWVLAPTGLGGQPNGAPEVYNRAYQEAFGKLVQHLTVQSRAYRIYVIGQVLDNSQNPHVSVAMEVGVYLQYNQTNAEYEPAIQYVHLLK